MDMDVRIEWGRDEQRWFAGFLRDGESYIMDGVCVGSGVTPERAVSNLLAMADALVTEAADDMGIISMADRVWLFKQLDRGTDYEAINARYNAIRNALGHDPYRPEPEVPQLSEEADRAISD